MATFPLSACDATMLQRRLHDDYRVEVPIINWNGRQLARVSVQGYKQYTLGDVEVFSVALKALLAQVGT